MEDRGPRPACHLACSAMTVGRIYALRKIPKCFRQVSDIHLMSHRGVEQFVECLVRAVRVPSRVGQDVYRCIQRGKVARFAGVAVSFNCQSFAPELSLLGVFRSCVGTSHHDRCRFVAHFPATAKVVSGQ